MPIETAILRTLCYADVFSFPMTSAEIQHFLIHPAPLERALIEQTLQSSARLQQYIVHKAGYYALLDNAHAIDLRQEREQLAEGMMHTAQQYAAWLARIPFVRMVALTGALAMRNPAHRDDDYDYFLITERGRVWLARFFAIVLVRLARLQGVELCPNYLVTTDELFQTRQDLYIAHEVTQMVPLYGVEWYQHMLSLNEWTRCFMPHAGTRHADAPVPQDWARLKQALETLLAGRVGDWLEGWEHRRKARKFKAQVSQRSDARIDESSIKGHFIDHGQRVLARYRARLAELGLADIEYGK